MAKYVYPAVFTAEEKGLYSINFPDLPHCYTCGQNLTHGYEMAEDVLAMVICELEDEKQPLPIPSDPKSISSGSDSFVSLVVCDTIAYRVQEDTRAVRRNITLPAWLDNAVSKSGLNVSGFVQKALIQELHLDRS